MEQDPAQGAPEGKKEGFKSKALKIFLGLLLATGCGALGYFISSLFGVKVWMAASGKTTVGNVVALQKSNPSYKFEANRWKGLVLVGLKEEGRLEVWGVPRQGGAKELLETFPFTGMSGTYGPKLSASDKQVPEGIYTVGHLNPNSAMHRSIRMDYPNVFDISKAYEDGRSDIHTDFLVHGGMTSAGSIAIGNEAIDKLFTMVYEVGTRNVTVIISPFDMRVWKHRLMFADGKAIDEMGKLDESPTLAAINWEGELYGRIRRAFENQFGQGKEKGTAPAPVPDAQPSADPLNKPPIMLPFERQ